MKDKKLMLFPLFLLLAALPLLMTGCIVSAQGGWGGVYVDERHHHVSTHAFVYYPDAMVYFDPGVSIYYWSDHGVWRHGPHLPPHVVIAHDRGYRFESDAREPYRVHDRVSEHFRPGARPPRAGERPPQFNQRPDRPGDRPGQPGQRPGRPGDNR